MAKPNADQLRFVSANNQQISVQNKLSEIVSVVDFGASPTANDNQTAFSLMEASNITHFYLPIGLFKLPNVTSLTKVYWGPGSIQFGTGANVYIQKGADFTGYPSRSVDGHVVINSPGDLILEPNGNVTLATKRLLNVGDPIGAQDAVTLNYITTQLIPRIAQLEADMLAVKSRLNM